MPFFGPLHLYPAEYGAATALTGGSDLGLRTAFKATGAPNYNHLAYLWIAADYLRDDLTLLRRHPGSYLRSVGKAWVVNFIPGVDLELLGQGTGTLTQLYEMFFYGVPYRFSHDTEQARPMRYLLLETTPSLAWRAAWGWAILMAASCLWFVSSLRNPWGGRVPATGSRLTADRNGNS